MRSLTKNTGEALWPSFDHVAVVHDWGNHHFTAQNIPCFLKYLYGEFSNCNPNLSFTLFRYYENVAVVSSSTSTRKSSHYHNKKNQYSPSIRSDAVAYIYDQNSQRKHNILGKQDSNVSRQMLLKQDSHSSRQMLLKQESFSSISRQDSNASHGSRQLLNKQDSQISYIDTRKSYLMRQDSDFPKRDLFCKQDSISYIEPRKEFKKNSVCGDDVSYIDHKRHQLVKQDSVVSFSDQRPTGMCVCVCVCICCCSFEEDYYSNANPFHFFFLWIFSTQICIELNWWSKIQWFHSLINEEVAYWNRTPYYNFRRWTETMTYIHIIMYQF